MFQAKCCLDSTTLVLNHNAAGDIWCLEKLFVCHNWEWSPTVGSGGQDTAKRPVLWDSPCKTCLWASRISSVDTEKQSSDNSKPPRRSGKQRNQTRKSSEHLTPTKCTYAFASCSYGSSNISSDSGEHGAWASSPPPSQRHCLNPQRNSVTAKETFYPPHSDRDKIDAHHPRVWWELRAFVLI